MAGSGGDEGIGEFETVALCLLTHVATCDLADTVGQRHTEHRVKQGLDCGFLPGPCPMPKFADREWCAEDGFG